MHIRPYMLTIVLALAGCGQEPENPPEVRSTPADLAAHTDEFRREVIEVTDGVHVAVGFGLANSILIEGDDGLIVVDTMESLEEARAVKAEFDKISTKPVKAIVYTHNHADHVFGAAAFAGDDAPMVLSHELTNYYLDRLISVVRPVITRRSARMFGSHLEGAALENAGIGPYLGLTGQSTVEVIRPTRTFSDRLEIEIAGVSMELVHAPGETNDQLFVWLPDKQTLLPGDNIYKTFPNLYTIRGTPYRDVAGWARSLDKMLTRQPEHLVPSHTRPVSGRAEVAEILTTYRDGIQYLHDQTIRGMNAGLTPDELAATIRLPAHLAESPYLHEFYGTVPWSVRNIFAGYLGWFDGNPSTLEPLTPDARTERMIALAGGYDELLAAATRASDHADDKWVLELTDHLLRAQPGDADAATLRAGALTRIGEAASNPNARHYYLTAAREITDRLEPGIVLRPTRSFVHGIPLRSIFESMAVNLNAERTTNIRRRVNFSFPDASETWSIDLRRGVADYQPYPLDEVDITVTVNATIWKEIISGMTNPAVAFARGDVKVDGATFDLVKFLGYFKAAE